MGNDRRLTALESFYNPNTREVLFARENFSSLAHPRFFYHLLEKFLAYPTNLCPQAKRHKLKFDYVCFFFKPVSLWKLQKGREISLYLVICTFLDGLSRCIIFLCMRELSFGAAWLVNEYNEFKIFFDIVLVNWLHQKTKTKTKGTHAILCLKKNEL